MCNKMNFIIFTCVMVVSVSCAPHDVTPDSTAVILAKGRAMQMLMSASMRQPDSRARLGEVIHEQRFSASRGTNIVLPLLRSMTRTQRVALADMLQKTPFTAIAASTVRNPAATRNATLGRVLPELDVVSLLRRGDEEKAREESEVARARALEIVEAAADHPALLYQASDRNDTVLEDNEEQLPVAEELKGRRLTPSELLNLIAANKRLPQDELVALIGEHHRRISEPRRPTPSGAKSPIRKPLRVPTRGQQQRVNGLRPPPPAVPEPSAADCDLYSNNLCLEVSEYPREAIISSMVRNPNAVHAMLAHESRLDLGERRQDDSENLVVEGEETLCQTAVKFARPKKARNVAGKWKFLVNMGSEHSQTMRIEMCNAPGEPCHYLANGVSSQCVQLFSHHRLMAWDKEEGLHIDIFKVPTCCSCHVKPAYGPAMFPQMTEAHTQRPPRPSPTEAEPEFVDGEEYNDGQESTFQNSRIPPQWPSRRPPYKQYVTPSPPIRETTTYQPPFNRDVPPRKRQRIRNKNRQDSDLDNSGSAPSSDRRKPIVSITSDQIRGASRPNIKPTDNMDDSSRINYNYHPIIDFFREDQYPMHANRRSDVVGDDWRPVMPPPPVPARGPTRIPLRRQ